jgi:hypothetical protein
MRWSSGFLNGRSKCLSHRAAVADGQTAMTAANQIAIRRALEAAGVEFIDENGGGAGVRMQKPSPGN